MFDEHLQVTVNLGMFDVHKLHTVSTVCRVILSIILLHNMC